MKKNILMCLGILFCSTLIFAKEYKITENPEEVIRPSILRLTDDGYRLIWNYNKKAKVTLGKVGGKTQKIVPVENTINTFFRKCRFCRDSLLPLVKEIMMLA